MMSIIQLHYAICRKLHTILYGYVFRFRKVGLTLSNEIEVYKRFDGTLPDINLVGFCFRPTEKALSAADSG